MKITAGTLCLVLAASLNSIEMSDEPPRTRDFLANFEMSNREANYREPSSLAKDLPDSEHIPNALHREPPESSRRNSHVTSRARVENSLPTRSRNLLAYDRSIIPPKTIHSIGGIEYELDQLQLIRLISYKNQHRIFVLRRYTFPVDKPIRLLAPRNVFLTLPTQEQIVLSSSDGNIYAILETSRTLAGIYSYNRRMHHKSRAKLNMDSGMVTVLTPDEVKEAPVGPWRQIPLCFKVQRINLNRQNH